MKTIGIIGGLSPESTITYYQGLNEGVRARLGGHHNAKIILNSVDFGEFVALKEKGDWDTQSALLCEAARGLEKGGADFIILATNTMHKMADDIIAAISIPFLHLGDATAQNIRAKGLGTIGLLGTIYTMEQDFYKGRLESHGLDVLTPDRAGREAVNTIIYDELCHGVAKDKSRDTYRDIILKLQDNGAQGIILGCTEIGMIVDQKSYDLSIFDTTQIHIEEALKLVFED
tara:strand:- start:401 stop:1093 length:693 start_codon:yes stop_codon:yes gene_type:complete